MILSTFTLKLVRSTWSSLDTAVVILQEHHALTVQSLAGSVQIVQEYLNPCQIDLQMAITTRVF